MESVSLFHANDIYNAEKASRFLYQWKQAKERELETAGRTCLSFFSGDAWSPSIMTTIVRGKQMIPVLNALKLDAACLGNHDLDLGLAEFAMLTAECNFPWICSNVRDKNVGEPLGGCEEYVLLEAANSKFLVLGLVEEEWIDTLSTIEPSDIDFEDFTVYVKRRVPELMAEHKDVDAVIAMSHMRMPNDYKLAKECSGYIDIILGGHDHHYEDTEINHIRILNSGTDFGDFTVIQILGRDDKVTIGDSSAILSHPLATKSERVNVDPKSSDEDPEMVEALKHIQEQMAASMDTVIGSTKVDLDARFSEIRTKETNISNLIATVMTRATGADVAILNAGSLRADRIIPKGPLKVRDLCDLLPMADPLAVVVLSGATLLQALENGVSKYPAMEGRFPCVSGVKFSFDPSKPAGERVVEGSVSVSKQSSGEYKPLDLDQNYRVVSKAYLLKGKDGYDMLAGQKIVVDDENCPALAIALRNLFTEISVMKRWEGLTSKSSVIAAASQFKKMIRRSIADPYAIRPKVDGRISNIAEA